MHLALVRGGLEALFTARNVVRILGFGPLLVIVLRGVIFWRGDGRLRVSLKNDVLGMGPPGAKQLAFFSSASDTTS